MIANRTAVFLRHVQVVTTVVRVGVKIGRDEKYVATRKWFVIVSHAITAAVLVSELYGLLGLFGK
jgi:hypothetical protein